MSNNLVIVVNNPKPNREQRRANPPKLELSRHGTIPPNIPNCVP
jgi:hypothetical protein